MTRRTKILLIIVIVVIVFLVVGFIFYLIITKPPVPAPLPIVEPRPPIGLPPTAIVPPVAPSAPPAPIPPVKEPSKPSSVARGELTQVNQISSDAATKVVLAPDGQNLRYYHPATGRFYSLSPDGQIKSLLAPNFFPEAKEVDWSPTRNQAILSFPDGSKVFYDFVQAKQVTLPKSWNDFSFNNSGTKIAFKVDNENTEKRWLAVANPDGSNAKAIEPMGRNADKVQTTWSPTEKVIAFFIESVNVDRKEVFFIGQNHENFKSMYVEGYGFESKWSPDGKQLLYSAHPMDPETGLKPELWTVDADGDSIGQHRRSLGVNTWIDKCIFTSDEKYIYCAVPRSLPVGAGPYPELAVNVPDDFYRINLRTGLKTFLAQPAGGDYNATDLFLSADKKILYFSDKINGGIYSLRLE